MDVTFWEFLEASSFLDVQTSIICTVACLVWIYILFRKPAGLPPGPSWRAPILGHLRELKGQNVRYVLDKYREKYGEIYSLYIGRQLVVIVSGLDAIREAFLNRREEFAFLPNAVMLEASSGKHDSADESMDMWMKLRALTTDSLMTLGFHESSMQSTIRDEVALLIEELEAYNAVAFNPKHVLTTSIFNTNCSLLVGTSYSHSDPEFQHVLRLSKQCSSAGCSTSVLKFLPFLRYLPGDVVRLNEFKALVSELNGYFEERIRTCKAKVDDGKDFKDFTSAFLNAAQLIPQNDTNECCFTEDNLKWLLCHMLCTGSESVVHTLCCGIDYLVKYPDIQERIYSEINQQVGGRRYPDLADREHLVFTNAFIMETQRMGKLATLSLPHTVKEDATLKGHIIPKGAIVFPDLQAVMSDPELWSDPHVFWPERFISKDGLLSKPERFIPFFSGQKTSVGEHLASMELFLFLSSLIQSLQFYSPDDATTTHGEEQGVYEAWAERKDNSSNVKVRMRNQHRQKTNQCC